MHEQFVAQKNVDGEMSVLSLVNSSEPNRKCTSLSFVFESGHCSVLRFVFRQAHSVKNSALGHKGRIVLM